MSIRSAPGSAAAAAGDPLPRFERRAPWCGARPTTTWLRVSSEDRFRVGLLGHGTVGAAFARLLPARADRIAVLTGLRPELSGVVTRSRGSFEELLEQSELIVELIGGIDL